VACHCPLASDDDSGDDTAASSFLQSIHRPISSAVADRPWGGIPLVESFGDCHQPDSSCWNENDIQSSPASSPHSACTNGCITFHDFLHPPPESGVMPLVVLMKEVVRQSGNP